MKRFIFCFSVLSMAIVGFCLAETRSFASKLKDIQFRGYITEVNSPTSFRVDDYRITVENERDIELENVEKKAVKFNPAEQIKVGTFIKVKGKYDPDTLETTVTEVKIDMKQFRKLSHTVVLDSKPTGVSRNSDGTWSGTLLADARRIVIDGKTNVRFKLNKAEEKEEKEAKKQREKEEKTKQAAEKEAKPDEPPPAIESDRSDESDPSDFDDEDDLKQLFIDSKPLQSLDEIGPGIYMTYRGTENLTGAVSAEEVVFVRNEKTKDEAKMWKELRLKQKEAKKANSFAELKVGDKKYKVLPEKEVQEYVARVGESLIPDYQKNLPEDNENKIPFTFTVVYEKGINAGAYPTGTVVINHDLFNYLENEAQLAFILSHEIAHATQEHGIRAQNKHKKKRRGLFIGRIASYAMGYGLIYNILTLTQAAMENGYNRNLENQADRIGISNMIVHGYDPREAPRSWKVNAIENGDFPKNIFWSSHDSNTERRSFLWLTIHNTYAGLDFSAMKKDSEEFQRIAGLVQEKYPAKKKNKKG